MMLYVLHNAHTHILLSNFANVTASEHNQSVPNDVIDGIQNELGWQHESTQIKDRPPSQMESATYVRETNGRRRH